MGRVLLLPAVSLLLACQTTLSRSAGDSREALVLVAQAQMALAEGQVKESLELFEQAVNLDPQSAELREEYGLVLAGLGIREKAVAQLRAAGERTSEGEAVLGLLSAQMATSAEELQEAVVHLERGTEAGPYADRVRQSLIEAYLRLGKGEEAWQNLSRLLEEHPDSPWLHLMAGRALRLLGRFSEAEAHLRQVSSTGELANQAASELVDVLVSQGKFKEAVALVEKTVKEGGSPTLPGLVRWAALLLRAQEVGKAAEILDEALKRDPNFTDALILRAATAIRQGKADEAEHLYRRALAVDPDDIDALVALGRLLMELRRLAEARELFIKAQGMLDKMAPEIRETLTEEQAALELLGRAYASALPFLQELAKKPLSRRRVALWAEYFRGQKRFAEGLTFFAQVQLDQSPEANSLARAVKGEFLLASGAQEKGLEELEALAQGQLEEVHLALAAASRAKLYQHVIAWAEKALERFPKDEDITFSLAASYERLGQFREAEKTFRELLATYPENASALNYLGYSFADRGINLQEAKELIEKAVALDPFSGAYLDSLGWVYFRLGDLDRAEKYLTQAAALEPFDATVHEHLGDLFKARGDTARAREAYKKALSFSPEEEGQEERIRAKLSQLATPPAP